MPQNLIAAPSYALVAACAISNPHRPGNRCCPSSSRRPATASPCNRLHPAPLSRTFPVTHVAVFLIPPNWSTNSGIEKSPWSLDDKIERRPSF
ncbi:dedicator of cytokinesis protein 4 isoform X1 [Sesbania bispinosa]|nr:dedicator of cytokinesis protein 4 isoform X1 [Sesbania bispinosa]